MSNIHDGICFGIFAWMSESGQLQRNGGEYHCFKSLKMKRFWLSHTRFTDVSSRTPTNIFRWAIKLYYFPNMQQCPNLKATVWTNIKENQDFRPLSLFSQCYLHPRILCIIVQNKTQQPPTTKTTKINDCKTISYNWRTSLNTFIHSKIVR